MARVRDVLDQALALSVKQRARLAQELLHSLDEGPPEDPEVVARAWDDEIARRVDDVRAGRARLVAWSAVKRDMERAIQSVRRRARRRAR
jgi:putative addiction module component (TIGR02574 family)